MDAQAFKDLYMQKVAGTFNGPNLAAMINVPNTDRSGGQMVQMDVPGLGETDRAGAVGVFGDQMMTDPKHIKFAEEHGLAPYIGQMKPPRSMTGKTFAAPAHPSFNREATQKYMPELMKGIGENQMPIYKYSTY